MLDTSKQSFVWQLILITPALLALIVATLNASLLLSAVFMTGWAIVNAVCSLWCAYDYSKITENPGLRYAKTLGIALPLWILNAGMSFFGGCACATFVGGL